MSHIVILYGPKGRIAHFQHLWSYITAGESGTRILNGGRFFWEFILSETVSGIGMIFGIGTKKASLEIDRYANNLGVNRNG